MDPQILSEAKLRTARRSLIQNKNPRQTSPWVLFHRKPTTKSSATWLFHPLPHLVWKYGPTALRPHPPRRTGLPFRIFTLILFSSSISKYTIILPDFQEAPSCPNLARRMSEELFGAKLRTAICFCPKSCRKRNFGQDLLLLFLSRLGDA